VGTVGGGIRGKETKKTKDCYSSQLRRKGIGIMTRRRGVSTGEEKVYCGKDLRIRLVLSWIE